MKKIDANKYIDWMLPFVKTEVSQANAKLGVVITSNSALLAALLVLIGFIHSFDVSGIALVILYLTISFLSFLQFASLLICFIANKPKYKHKNHKSNLQFDESKFFTFNSLSLDDFLEKFNISSDLEKKMLEQIYINGNLANDKYKICNIALKFSIPFILFFNVK